MKKSANDLIEINDHLKMLTDAEIEAFKVFHPNIPIRGKNVIIDIRKRILDTIKDQSLTIYKVSKSAQVNSSNLYQFLKGNRGMEIEALERILGVLGL